jgi:hypothetical protein
MAPVPSWRARARLRVMTEPEPPFTDPLPFSAPSLILHSFPAHPRACPATGPDSAHAASPCAQGPPPDIRAHQLSHPLWLLWLVSPLFSSIHPQDRPCARTGAWPDTGLAAKCGPRPPSRPLAGSGEQLRMRQCRIATNWIKSPLHQAGLPRAALRPQRDPGCKGNRIAAAPRAMGPGPLPVFTMPAHGCHSTAVFPCRPLSSTVKCGSKRRKTTVLRVSCDLQRANLALGPTQNFGETLP